MLTATALLALSAPLAACGTGGDDQPASPATTAEQTTDATTAPEPTDDTTTGGTTDAPTDGATTPSEGATGGVVPGDDMNSGAFAAIELAEAEAGGTAFEIDRDDLGAGGWEVSVAVGDDEVDVDIDREGTEVLGTDTDDDLDAEERAALDTATVTLADAIQTALDEVGGGLLDDVELDEERDTVAWEVTIDDGAGSDDVEVYVDIVTGEVVQADRG